VVNVEDPCPSGRSELNRSDELPGDERSYKVVDLLPVSDPGERGVLPADEHAGVKHDARQETSLTFCETERQEKLNSLGCRLVRLQHIRG
jgi:hypothetical protein